MASYEWTGLSTTAFGTVETDARRPPHHGDTALFTANYTQPCAGSNQLSIFAGGDENLHGMPGHRSNAAPLQVGSRC